MIAKFWDEQVGGFYFTSSDHEELITRTKDYFDNATPSGNSVAAVALLKMGLLTQNGVYSHHAATVLRTMRAAMGRYPSAFGYMLGALDFYLSEPKEIALIGSLDSHEIRSFVEAIYLRYLPNKVVAASEPNDEQSPSAIALLADRTAIDSKATAYVCRNYVCLEPATSVEDLTARLEA
jgi:uncharacterized protein YyaL (SSP411 family)